MKWDTVLILWQMSQRPLNEVSFTIYACTPDRALWAPDRPHRVVSIYSLIVRINGSPLFKTSRSVANLLVKFFSSHEGWYLIQGEITLVTVISTRRRKYNFWKIWVKFKNNCHGAHLLLPCINVSMIWLYRSLKYRYNMKQLASNLRQCRKRIPCLFTRLNSQQN